MSPFFLTTIIWIKPPVEEEEEEEEEYRSDGVWDGDYGWGVRVRRPFGARGMSSVRYGTRLGDLKENWFLLCSN